MADPVGSRSRLWAGLILIALGVLFLFDRLLIIDFGNFVRMWWPMILVGVALWHLAVQRRRRLGGPLLLIALGIFFQVERLGWFPWWSAENLWPVMLIAIGLWLLAARVRPPALAGSAGAKEESGEVVNAFVMFGGLERAATSKQFAGGEGTAIMGGINLDLRQAELAPGEQRLELAAIFGGIKLRVPDHWQVSIEGTPLLGAIEDKRKPWAPSASPAPEGAVAGGSLRVRAFALFGGIEVKS